MISGNSGAKMGTVSIYNNVFYKCVQTDTYTAMPFGWMFVVLLRLSVVLRHDEHCRYQRK